jgi:hypothetical protein
VLKQRAAANITRFQLGVFLLLLQLLLAPGSMLQKEDQRTKINMSALRQLGQGCA